MRKLTLLDVGVFSLQTGAETVESLAGFANHHSGGVGSAPHESHGSEEGKRGKEGGKTDTRKGVMERTKKM